jgi:tetratricopeptide (TPR) repeat protein
LDLQAEQHDADAACQDLYEATADLKRRHDLHPCAVRPRDGFCLRRDSEREAVQDLVKRFRDLPADQQRRLPALLNSLAQLEIVVGDLEAAQHDFQEAAGLVSDPLSQAEAHHNVYRAALERRDGGEALAALRRAAALDPESFEPFPLGRYEPIRLLGAGGFGPSFLCHDREADRKVVVKALRSDALDRGVETVFQETAWIQEIDHPALIRVRACAFAGAEQGRPYFVMEHFEGQTLMDHVAQHGPLAPEDWLAVGWQIGTALLALHDRGLLHRSLRPSAVLVRRETTAEGKTRWRVKLLDAGLSLKRTVIHASASNHAACVQTTLGRSVARTIAYAAPELLGKPKGQVWVGPHSDVYSFGKLSAFALTGHPDPDGGDLVLLPEGWKSLLPDLAAWPLLKRLPHFGAVLPCLAHLPGAKDIVAAVGRDLFESTIAEHTAALAADPKDFAALVRRAEAYAGRDDFAPAVADFTEALRLHPEDASLYRRRGLAHTGAGALDKAVADLTEALQREPHHLETLTDRALVYAQRHEHDQAIADLTEAIRLNSRDAALYSNRGDAYYAKADYDRAITDYTETVRLAPCHVWGLAQRGRAYALRGDHDKAVADFSRILTLAPNRAQALADRARAYVAMRQYDKALADYDAAIAAGPGSADVYRDRADLRRQRGDREGALDDYTEALRRNPDDVESYCGRGRLFMEMGDFDKALADNLEALKRAPSDAPTLNNLAWLWATHPDPQRRDPAKAEEHARQACGLTNDQEPAHLDTLAAALAAAGKYAEAAEQQRKAVELASDGEKADYQARLALYAAGRSYQR